MDLKVGKPWQYGGEEANCRTEELEATFVPTWFGAIPDVELPPILWNVSHVLLTCLQ